VALFSGQGASQRLIAPELEQAIRFACLAESFSTSTWRVRDLERPVENRLALDYPLAACLIAGASVAVSADA
jgi:hypothetical protein